MAEAQAAAGLRQGEAAGAARLQAVGADPAVEAELLREVAVEAGLLREVAGAEELRHLAEEVVVEVLHLVVVGEVARFRRVAEGVEEELPCLAEEEEEREEVVEVDPHSGPVAGPLDCAF